jgi:hypothetical protein
VSVTSGLKSRTIGLGARSCRSQPHPSGSAPWGIPRPPVKRPHPTALCTLMPGRTAPARNERATNLARVSLSFGVSPTRVGLPVVPEEA